MPPTAKAEKPARTENTALLRDIGARLRHERAKRAVTRKTLAQQCQTSERYLAQIELGEANPSVLVLDSIARALDLDLFEILPPSDTEQRPVVSVGSQIGSRVYVGAKQEVGGDSSAVTFEYRFARFLRLVTTFAQGALQAHSLERSETAGIDLLFVFRY